MEVFSLILLFQLLISFLDHFVGGQVRFFFVLIFYGAAEWRGLILFLSWAYMKVMHCVKRVKYGYWVRFFFVFGGVFSFLLSFLCVRVCGGGVPLKLFNAVGCHGSLDATICIDMGSAGVFSSLS